MNSVEKELRELLNDRQKKEWLKAIETLKIAFAWCVEAATPEQIMGNIPQHQKRAEALRLLFSLADALEQGKVYFQEVPKFFSIGQSNTDTEQDIKEGEQRLLEIKTELEQVIQQEEALRKQAIEQESLQNALKERKKELERLHQLTDSQAVEALKQQVKELEERLPLEGLEAERLIREIRGKGGKLFTIYVSYLNDLNPQVCSLLEQVAVKEQELQKLIDELLSARNRYSEIQQEVEKRKEELKPYIEANRIVAQALPGAQDVLSLLDKAEELVRDAEKAIKTIINDNEQQAQCEVIRFRGEV